MSLGTGTYLKDSQPLTIHEQRVHEGRQCHSGKEQRCPNAERAAEGLGSELKKETPAFFYLDKEYPDSLVMGTSHEIR